MKIDFHNTEYHQLTCLIIASVVYNLYLSCLTAISRLPKIKKISSPSCQGSWGSHQPSNDPVFLNVKWIDCCKFSKTLE